MNILLTLNNAYLDIAKIMLKSLYLNNKDENIKLYVISKDLQDKDFPKEYDISIINPELNLDSAFTTARYPEEMYYRLFASSLLSDDIDKILYLDPDIIVNKSLRELYETNIEGYYAAGCTHIKEPLTKLNALRIGAENATTYLNTGVLLLNIKSLRSSFDKEKILKTIMDNRHRLLLPDQDIITLLYQDKILKIDSIRYNLSDRIYTLEKLRGAKYLSLDYVRKNTAIIHYCGKNKPWRKGYHGELGVFFEEYKNI